MLRATKTENGLVKGLVGTNVRITVYKGIPYAAPPVGEPILLYNLRFA